MQTTEERFKNIKRRGVRAKWTQDLYHSLLMFSWGQFFLSYVLFFFVFNLFFATIYFVVPGSLLGTQGTFWNTFAFSVQTFSTVGYGVFSPATDLAHAIVIVESIFSVFVTALLTGLIFSKFSRPMARVIFSNNVLINTFEGRRTLMLRMGNLRANHIAEAQVRMMVLKTVKTAEGQTLRRQVDLNLVRSSSLFFAMTWTVMHIVDESSPFYNLSSSDIVSQDMEVGVSVIGYDSTFSQTIHSNIIYRPEDILFDKYFVDIIDLAGAQVRTIDYTKFHLVQ